MSMQNLINPAYTALQLTSQEKKVIQFLVGKDKVYWEQLTQFGKDPQTVKQKTLQKVVSDIRKKYKDAGITCPFNCTFDLMVKPGSKEDPSYINVFDSESAYNINAEDLIASFINDAKPFEKIAQTFVKLNRDHLSTLENKKDDLNVNSKREDIASVPIKEELPAHRDFVLEKNYKRVRTKNGTVELRDQEWEIFCHLHDNAEKVIGLEEIKNVVWKNWGSKTPPSWAESIARSLTNLRKSIPELKLQNRLLTIVGQTTSYMLK